MTQFKTKYGHSVALILLFCLAINVTNGFLDDQTFRRQKSEENKRISQSLFQTKHESEIITNQDKEGETQLHRSSSMARDGVPMIQNRRESYNQVTNRQSRICQSPACTEKRESINLSIRSQDSVDRKTVNNRREHRNNLNLLIKSQRLSNEQGTIQYNQGRRDLIEKSVRGGEINNNRFRHDSRLRNERDRDRDYFTDREQERTIDSRNNNLIRENRKHNQRERVLSNDSRLNRSKGNTREVQSRRSRENIRDITVSPQRIRETYFRDQNTEQERRKFIIDSRNFRVNEQVQNRNVENRDVTRKCINNCDKREHFDRNVRLQSQISSSALTGILRNTLGENRGSERHFSITDTRREVRDNLDRRNVRDNTQRNTNMQTLRDSRNNVERENTILTDTRRQIRVDTDRNLERTIRNNVVDISRQNEITRKQSGREDILDRRSERRVHDNREREITDNINNAERISRKNIDGSILTDTRREIRVNVYRNLERIVPSSIGLDISQQNEITRTQSRRENILDRRSERRVRDKRERENHIRSTTANTRREVRDDLNRRNIRDNTDNTILADTRRETRIDADRNLKQTIRSNVGRNISEQKERDNIDRSTTSNTRREVTDDMNLRPIRDITERSYDFSTTRVSRENTDTRREIRVDEDRNLEHSVRINAERDSTRQNKITSRHILDSRSERETRDNRERENGDRFTIINTRREIRDDLDRRNVRDNRERNNDFSNNIQNRRNLNIARVSRENTDTRREIRVDEDRNLERSVRNNGERSTSRQNEIASRHLLDSRLERKIRDNRHRENSDRFTIINTRREVRDDLDRKNVRDNLERNKDFSHDIQNSRNLNVRKNTETRREIRVDEDRNLERNVRNNAERDAIRQNEITSRHISDSRLEREIHDNRARENSDRSTITNTRREVRDDLDRRNVRDNTERNKDFSNDIQNRRNLNIVRVSRENTDTRREIRVEEDRNLERSVRNNAERDNTRQNQITSRKIVDSRLERELRDNRERENGNRFTIINNRREVRDDLDHRNVRDNTERSNAFSNNIQTDRNNPVVNAVRVSRDTRREIRVAEDRHLEHIVRNAERDAIRDNRNNLDRRSEHKFRDNRVRIIRETTDHSITSNVRREIRDDLNRRNIRNSEERDTSRENRKALYRNIRDTLTETRRENVDRFISTRGQIKNNLERNDRTDNQRELTNTVDNRLKHNVRGNTERIRENIDRHRETRFDLNRERTERDDSRRNGRSVNTEIRREIRNLVRSVHDNSERENIDRVTLVENRNNRRIETRRENINNLDRRLENYDRGSTERTGRDNDRLVLTNSIRVGQNVEHGKIKNKFRDVPLESRRELTNNRDINISGNRYKQADNRDLTLSIRRESRILDGNSRNIFERDLTIRTRDRESRGTDVKMNRNWIPDEIREDSRINPENYVKVNFKSDSHFNEIERTLVSHREVPDFNRGQVKISTDDHVKRQLRNGGNKIVMDNGQQIPNKIKMSSKELDYLPNLNSTMLWNTVKIILASILFAQVLSSSSKTKKFRLQDSFYFVTLHKEKVN